MTVLIERTLMKKNRKNQSNIPNGKKVHLTLEQRKSERRVWPSEPDILLWPRPYIPRWLDDFYLTASEFRVFLHVLRRESGYKGRGRCDESVKNMAKVCRLHKNTITRSLKELVKLGLLKRKDRYKQPNLYTVVPSWQERKRGGHPTMPF